MKDKSIIRKITQGMYIVTTYGGGCCVDNVSQISGGDKPLLSLAIMKENYTNKIMKENNKYAISILGMNVDPELIKIYGFKSMKDHDKFNNSETIEIDGLNIIKDSIGYIICEKIAEFENETHTVFIGKAIDGDKFNDEEPMTYGYYQKHKEELLKIKTISGETAWICTVCGHIYYGDEVPDDYKCPICGMDKEYFEIKKD